MSQYQAYLYSQDTKLTITDLRQNNYQMDIDVSSVEQRCLQHGVQCIIEGDPQYHYKWHHLYNKPYIVYAMGNIDLLNKKLLGVVGPRSMTPYGERVVSDLMTQAKTYDLVTISGLAPGIDTTTHTQSIAQGIPTIAILGGGLHYFLQQPTKKRLIQNIVEGGGLVLSEFKLKTVPTTYTFPQRNRIIAGLCDILIVPEAGVKSGSLITVDSALRLNKPVYGFPNSIYSESSAGLHQYMYSQKVRCISEIRPVLDDHFESIHSDQKQESYTVIVSPEEQKVLSLRESSSCLSIEEIHQHTGYSTPAIMGYLGALELYGYIRQSGVNQYQRL